MEKLREKIRTNVENTLTIYGLIQELTRFVDKEDKIAGVDRSELFQHIWDFDPTKPSELNDDMGILTKMNEFHASHNVKFGEKMNTKILLEFNPYEYIENVRLQNILKHNIFNVNPNVPSDVDNVETVSITHKFDMNEPSTREELVRITKSMDLASVIWEFVYNSRKGIGWEFDAKITDMKESDEVKSAYSRGVIDTMERLYDKFTEICEEHGVDVDDMIS